MQFIESIPECSSPVAMLDIITQANEMITASIFENVLQKFFGDDMTSAGNEVLLKTKILALQNFEKVRKRNKKVITAIHDDIL